MQLLTTLRKLLMPAPVTPEQMKLAEQENIEFSANLVQAKIQQSRTLADCYDALDLVLDFKAVWGYSVQARAWFDSLMLTLWGREREILQNL